MTCDHIPLIENLDGAKYSQMALTFPLKDEYLEGVLVRPGSDLGGVQTVESVHLAEDVPHHVGLRELQSDVALSWQCKVDD